MIATTCVISMRKAWFSLLQQVGLSTLALQPSDTSLDEWWSRLERVVTGDVKKEAKGQRV